MNEARVSASILYEFTALAAAHGSRAEVMDMMLEKATRLLASDAAILYRWDGHELQASVAAGIRTERSPELLISSASDATDWLDVGLAFVAASPPPASSFTHKGRYAAMIAVPLKLHEQRLGVLLAMRVRGLGYDELEQALYSALGAQTVSAIELGEARERDQQQRDELLRRSEELSELVRALSTPVLEVSSGTVLVPLVGALSARRIQDLSEKVLQAIQRKDIFCVVLDVTGVPELNEEAACGLRDVRHAASLMGANVVLCGVTPRLAITLIALDLDRSGFEILPDLQSAIAWTQRLSPA